MDPRKEEAEWRRGEWREAESVVRRGCKAVEAAEAAIDVGLREELRRGMNGSGSIESNKEGVEAEETREVAVWKNRQRKECSLGGIRKATKLNDA